MIQKWIHELCDKARTREQAIEKLFKLYDAHPGQRRRPAQEAFEVYRAKKGPFRWTLYVRRRRP